MTSYFGYTVSRASLGQIDRLDNVHDRWRNLHTCAYLTDFSFTKATPFRIAFARPFKRKGPSLRSRTTARSMVLVALANVARPQQESTRFLGEQLLWSLYPHFMEGARLEVLISIIRRRDSNIDRAVAYSFREVRRIEFISKPFGTALLFNKLKNITDATVEKPAKFIHRL